MPNHDLVWPTINSAYPDLSDGAEVNRGRTGKRIASGLATASSVGATGALAGTGTSTLAVGAAVATGAAVSATGVGLVATAAALTVGSIVVNARSMVKSLAHVENLREIQANYQAGRYARCRCRPGVHELDRMIYDHDMIGHGVLTYIIQQKTDKAVKKGVGTFGLGMLTTIYTMGRAAYKSLASTKGVKRNLHAHVLARHLITHDCPLAEVIVAELLSASEMEILKTRNSDIAGAAIADKMKSV